MFHCCDNCISEERERERERETETERERRICSVTAKYPIQIGLTIYSIQFTEFIFFNFLLDTYKI